MPSDPEVLAAFREQIGRAFAQWRPGTEEVRRFQERLQATLEKVRADASPLTLIEQTGTAIAEAQTPFEAFGHLAMLEVYAKSSSDERLLRYCKLVADVFRLLTAAARAQHAEGAPAAEAEPDREQALFDLRLAGRTIAAVAAMDRDEPRLVDARLLAFASGGELAAGIAGLVLQTLAELRREQPS